MGLTRALASRHTGRAHMRLLVVEDNEELAQLLAKGLRSAGFEVDLLASVGMEILPSEARSSARSSGLGDFMTGSSIRSWTAFHPYPAAE